jgi:hypothetical protein
VPSGVQRVPHPLTDLDVLLDVTLTRGTATLYPQPYALHPLPYIWGGGGTWLETGRPTTPAASSSAPSACECVSV